MTPLPSVIQPFDFALNATPKRINTRNTGNASTVQHANPVRLLEPIGMCAARAIRSDEAHQTTKKVWLMCVCVCCHMLISRNRTGTDGTDGARCTSITMRRNPSAGLRKTVLVTRSRPTGPFPLRSVSGKFGKSEVGKLGPGHD